MSGVASNQSKTDYNTYEFKVLFESMLLLVEYEQILYQNLDENTRDNLNKMIYLAM